MEGEGWRERDGGRGLEGEGWRERDGGRGMEGEGWRERDGGSGMEGEVWRERDVSGGSDNVSSWRQGLDIGTRTTLFHLVTFVTIVSSAKEGET